MLRKQELHLFLSIIDTGIILIKILNLNQTDYNTHLDRVYKELTPALFLLDDSIIIRILLVIYLIIVYLISILSLLYGNNKRINKFEMTMINLFRILFIRIFFIFFREFLFFLPFKFFITLYIKFTFFNFYFY